MSEGSNLLNGRLGMAGDVRLLESIAEQLKLPLAVIARQAELSDVEGAITPEDLQVIVRQAAMAVGLVDNYLLGLQLAEGQVELALEPLSAAAVLTDVAHELDSFAKQYGVHLALHIAGRYEPVVAHRRTLRAALTSLGYELIAAQAAHQAGSEFDGKTPGARLTLASHRTSQGIVVGMYGDYEILSESRWRSALALCGRAHQPFGALVSGSAAGLFVAEALLEAMAARLRVGRFQNQRGMAVTLQPSCQLRLV